MCTYHPDTLTVRASFSVPGRGGVVGSGSAISPSEWDNDRNARNRKFKMVGKSALVLKEDYTDDFPSDGDDKIGQRNKTADEQSDLGTVDELHINDFKSDANSTTAIANNLVSSEQEGRTNFRNAKYARLVNEKQYINENYRMRSGNIRLSLTIFYITEIV